VSGLHIALNEQNISRHMLSQIQILVGHALYNTYTNFILE